VVIFLAVVQSFFGDAVAKSPDEECSTAIKKGELGYCLREIKRGRFHSFELNPADEPDNWYHFEVGIKLVENNGTVMRVHPTVANENRGRMFPPSRHCHL